MFTSHKRTTRTILVCSVLTLSILMANLMLWRTHNDAPSTPGQQARASETFGKLPLYFIENHGQTDERVAYYVQGNDKAIYFTDQGLTFVLNGVRSAECGLRNETSLQPVSFNPHRDLPTNPQSERWALKLDFIGARAGVHPEGEAQTEAVISYFKGHASKWKTGLKTYSRVVYHDLWPGIDLVYAGTANRMKYSFIVRPGADPNQIKLAYRGASGVTLNAGGQLDVRTPVGGFTDDRPVSFQEVGGKQVEVTTAYALDADGQPGAASYGFALGGYDRSRELVIDPAVLIYAGFIGGGGEDFGNGIAVDNAGNAYIVGDTTSTEATFPDGDGFGALVGPDSIYNNNTDAFVAKVNAAGTALVYAGYIGGGGFDRGYGIAVDNGGNAYITGQTSSPEATFPDGDGFGVLNGPDTTFNGGFGDAFVVKVNAAGTALVYAGYIGGSGDDRGYAIAVDNGGNAYIVGNTASTEVTFPDGDGFGAVTGPDTSFNGGSSDAFVAKINAAGTALVYAGYIGGNDYEQGFGIAVDSTGNAYVSGTTASTQTSFPDGDGFGALVGPDTTFNGGTFDAFIAKVNSAGTALIYAGYIGGSGDDDGRGIAVDSAGNAYVTGRTASTEATFPDGDGFGGVTGPDTTYNGGFDAFVAKVNAGGTALAYAGYIGGSGLEFGLGIAVDSAGNAYVTGYTESTEATFPNGDGFGTLTGPDTTFNGGQEDAFVAKVNAPGTALIYAGYIGGSDNDTGKGIAVDSAGNAYICGDTLSSETTFPNGAGFGVLTGPDTSFNGLHDAFVAKIQAFNPPITVNTTADTVAADGFCSLREAIQAANTNTAVNECQAGAPGLDNIIFSLGAGPPPINVTSALPTITEPVVIDGATGGATRVELNGAGAGAGIVGLSIGGANSTIRSLVINRFSASGMQLGGTGGHTIENCYIGTNAAGTAPLGNGQDGVRINGIPNNRIGGLVPAARNLISGNSQYGVLIFNAGATGNQVQGNYIGTNAAGTSAIGNGLGGVRISSASNNLIGGTSSGARNYISGNTNEGIFLLGTAATGNQIQDNFIGIAADNVTPLGNTRDGVQIDGAVGNLIGGANTIAGNDIANNGRAGVFVTNGFGPGTGNAIQANSIFNNTGLGIDLAANTGVTANDAGDGDTGPNNLQNYPVLTSAVTNGVNTLIQGTLNSTANTSFHIEFFSNPTCDASGNGEGLVFLSFVNVTTDSSGNANININLPIAIALGQAITATATDALNNNTSEFSQCFVVGACSYMLNAMSADFLGTGGSGMVNVITSSICGWTATSNAPWITVTGGSSGTGSGTVSYLVAANLGATPRTGTVTAAGNTFTVNQSTTVLVFTDFNGGIPDDWTVVHGGTGTYPNNQPATWTAGNPCNRVIPPPFSGSFAIVDASCANPGATFDERLITPAFNATGVGAVYVEFFNRFGGIGAPNNIGDVEVSINGGVSWLASPVHRFQNVDDGFPTPVTSSFDITPFIAANPANVRVRLRYTGVGVASLRQPANPESQEVYWGVDFSIYYYALNPTGQNFSASGGSGNVSVSTSALVPSPQGAWTATSNAAWITLAAQGGTGNGSIGYTVAANSTASPRTGTVTIAGNTFTVTQNACTPATISPATLSNGFVGAAYNQTLMASGGVAPYAFSVGAGTLPNGLTLSSGGVLSGTPTTNGTFSFTVKTTDGIGCMGTQHYTVIISGDGPNSLVFYSLPRPVRLLDTRAGAGNCDNVGTPITGGTSLTTLARLTCEGILIPDTAKAITGNLTVINKTSQIGYLTVYPDGQAVPLASNMIYEPNGILSNNFTVGLSADGKFNVFGERTIDVVVDISGYYAPPVASGLYYHPLSKPVRLLDTRPGQGNCDSVGTPITGGTSITTLARVSCDGVIIPTAAQAIVGNATVINGSGQTGYLTIYPNGVTAPLAANLIYFPGQIISNAFTVSLNASGEFNIFGERTIDIAIDVAGYYSSEAVDANGAGLLLTPLARPLRILDTRAGQGNCDVVSTPITGGSSIAGPGRLTCESLTIPASAQSILGNVTVVNQTATAGFLTLYPDGVSQPLVANMIYFPNQILSNAFVVGLNSGTGQFRIFAERTLDAIVDVSGFFAP